MSAFCVGVATGLGGYTLLTLGLVASAFATGTQRSENPTGLSSLIVLPAICVIIIAASLIAARRRPNSWRLLGALLAVSWIAGIAVLGVLSGTRHDIGFGLLVTAMFFGLSMAGARVGRGAAT